MDVLLICPGTPLRAGITTLKNDDDIDDFVNLGYQNKWVVDLYVQHNGYDALDIRDLLETMVHDEGNESSDAYCSSDDEDLGFCGFSY
nr:RNA-directed DNA polymerase, eukaryota [Tanacetum cinerariifolium]